MRRRFRSTGVRLVAALVVALVAAGAALAYFTSTGGGGSGGAAVGAPAALTIAASTPAGGLLYPGGTGEVDVTIANPNGFPVRVNSLVLGGAGISVDGTHAGCDTSALRYTTQTNAGAGWTVPAKVGSVDGRLDLQLADAIGMDGSAANACQGATFTVSLATGP